PETPPTRMFWKLVRWLVTIHIVCASWVLFRAESLGDAGIVYERILTGAPGMAFDLLWPVAMLLIVVGSDLLGLRQRLVDLMRERPFLATVMSVLTLVILAAVIRGSRNPEFIYFQF
ncbi:MAG: hypothetical protein ACO38P_13385, partial [Phycisphaerales bacterium]